MKKSETNTTQIVNFKETILNNFNLYGFVAYKTIGIGEVEFDVVASAFSTTIYLATIELHKTHIFSTKLLNTTQKNFMRRLVARGVECGVAIKIDEGAIFYLPYKLVVATQEEDIDINITQLNLLNSHLRTWRTKYEHDNR